MTITKNKDGEKLTLALNGRLDTVSSPLLETALKEDADGISELELDFSELAYISSAGLRVLLSAQKAMAGKGSMTIRNVCPDIMEIFEITGFSDILTIA